jgi:hypothetical protein
VVQTRAALGYELCLRLKRTVWKDNDRKNLGKPTGSALDRDDDYHPSTIGIGWTWVRVKYDEYVPDSKSTFQAGR